MSELQCDEIRDLIPDFAGGRTSSDVASRVSTHLAVCDECRAEAELATLVFRARPEPPPELQARIAGAVRFRRNTFARPWWGLAAAAVAALALGIGVTSHRQPSEADVPAYVAGVDEEPLWVSDDGLIAGAPALEGLSDEALQTLLDEMSTEAQGGQA
ncbi:MAG: zf-HC2 domain-containing protein [Gemmatimonadota bacterium]|jgi:predicted anti-sigma-YlaC factor YlaD